MGSRQLVNQDKIIRMSEKVIPCLSKVNDENTKLLSTLDAFLGTGNNPASWTGLTAYYWFCGSYRSLMRNTVNVVNTSVGFGRFVAVAASLVDDKDKETKLKKHADDLNAINTKAFELFKKIKGSVGIN